MVRNETGVVSDVTFKLTGKRSLFLYNLFKSGIVGEFCPKSTFFLPAQLLGKIIRVQSSHAESDVTCYEKRMFTGIISYIRDISLS